MLSTPIHFSSAVPSVLLLVCIHHSRCESHCFLHTIERQCPIGQDAIGGLDKNTCLWKLYRIGLNHGRIRSPTSGQAHTGSSHHFYFLPPRAVSMTRLMLLEAVRACHQRQQLEKEAWESLPLSALGGNPGEGSLKLARLR
ncbi:hypothetical protein V8C34DRAFT_234317 [Trichoderma compactum]